MEFTRFILFIRLIFALVINTPEAGSVYIDTQSQRIQNNSLSLNDSDDAYLNVYQSIYGSQSSITSSSKGFLRCAAEHSCSEIESISLNVQYFRYLQPLLDCQGKDSCSFIQSIKGLIRNEVFTPVLEGSGYRSFANSIIESERSSIHCYGQMSCSYSTIHSGYLLYALGLYSLMNATIESMGNISLYLSGYYAAYGATFHCNEGHECNINCESMTGCFMMHLICDGECKINSLSAIVMLPITDASEFYPISNISTSLDHNAKCSNYTFDNYRYDERAHDMILDDSIGPVCCRASSSCANIDISYSVPSSIMKCGGYLSCEHSDIDVVGDVHCTGSYSCKEGYVFNATNVHCAAVNSCQLTRLSSGPMPSDFVYRSGYYPNPTASMNIWCTGANACLDATIYVERGYLLSLYLFGKESGKKANVNCEGGSICNIYCYAASSCSGMILEGYGIFNVECDELSDCPDGYTTDPTMYPTVHPIISPTNEPTYLPTFNPTHKPFLERESNVGDGSSRNDLVLTTKYSQVDQLEQSDDVLTIIILVATGSATFVCILVFCCCICMKVKKANKENETHHKELQLAGSSSSASVSRTNTNAKIYYLDDEVDEKQEGIAENIEGTQNEKNETMTAGYVDRKLPTQNDIVVMDEFEIIGDGEHQTNGGLKTPN